MDLCIYLYSHMSIPFFPSPLRAHNNIFLTDSLFSLMLCSLYNVMADADAGN
jgi:hypothetical protein